MFTNFVAGVFVCVCLFSLVAHAANNIRGQVLDPTHVPIARAPVRLLTSSQIAMAQTFTDQQGRFTFAETCSPGCTVEIQIGWLPHQTSAGFVGGSGD